MRVVVNLGEHTDAFIGRLTTELPDVEIVAAGGSGGGGVRVERPGNERPLGAPETARGDVLLTRSIDSPDLRRLVAGSEWVHVLGTGVDGFPFEAVPEGAVLTCSRGASAVPIAEFVLAVMLAYEKRLPETWVDAPPASWNQARLGVLSGKTCAIVGLGAIGTEVARRAVAFDMRVLAIRRRAIPCGIEGVSVLGSLAESLPLADHLVISAPATPDTDKLIARPELERVKRGMHLVNIARGTLVDQDALVEALDDGRVGRASLDVVDPEPLPAGHPLYSHPAVRLSPHVSWSGPVTLHRILEMFVDNVGRYRAGEPLEGVVDTALGY